MTDLTGKTALVIGGSGGIGLALACGLAEAGAGVTVAARSQEKVDHAAAEISTRDRTALGLTADVSHIAEIERLFAAVRDARGCPDILVNCQGTIVIGPTLETSPDDYDRVMAVNLRSVLFSCTVFGRAMVDRGHGTIINIASLAAHRGWPNGAIYAMSKHGVLGLTRTLGAEWAGQGVRVNSISPGFFMTDLNRERMSDARKATARGRTPAGRFGETNELVGALLYLCSDAAGFVTGTDIAVDGGYLASGI